MKSSFRILAVLVPLIAVPLVLSAVQSPAAEAHPKPAQGQGGGGPGGGQGGGGGPGGGRGGGPREMVGLEGSMKGLNMGLKRIQGALEKKDLAGIAAIAVDMQRAAGLAKLETPPSAEKITDAAKKAEFVMGFRLMLVDLQRALLDLEVAALNGKADDIRKIVDDKLKPMRNAGHDKYDPHEDK